MPLSVLPGPPPHSASPQTCRAITIAQQCTWPYDLPGLDRQDEHPVLHLTVRQYPWLHLAGKATASTLSMEHSPQPPAIHLTRNATASISDCTWPAKLQPPHFDLPGLEPHNQHPAIHWTQIITANIHCT